MAEILTWLNTYWPHLLSVAFLALYRKSIYKDFIFNPLAGGNGKIQMDEAVKGIIILVVVTTVYRDATRGHEWRYFSDAFYAVLFAGLFGMAAIKPATGVLHNVFGKDKPEDKHEEVEPTPLDKIN